MGMDDVMFWLLVGGVALASVALVLSLLGLHSRSCKKAEKENDNAPARIIKKGSSYLRFHCTTCGCVFDGLAEDIARHRYATTPSVACPNCGAWIHLTSAQAVIDENAEELEGDENEVR
jgi:uncharacterized Zn finger protein (UPF0148 family)